MQIVILGMHRSGTSMVTGLVTMLKAYFSPADLIMPVQPENSKGFWERTDVLHANDELLREQHCSWDKPLQWNNNFRPAAQNIRRLQDIVRQLDAHKPWVMKDPRLCLTLPFWRPLLKTPVCVIVYRNPLEIAESLYVRNKIPHARGIALWEFYAVSLLNASRDLPRVFVIHSDFFHDPVSTAAQLYQGLVAHGVQGLQLPPTHTITGFIDKKLYRSQAKEYALTGYQQELITMLQGEIMPETELTVSEESKKLLQ